MRIPFMRYFAVYLAVAMFVIAVAPRLDAGMVPSALIASSQIDRAADIGKIQRALEMKAVKDRLERLGLTSDEIKARFDSLSDQQLHQLALQIDDLRVGRDDALGVVIALLVIAILVIVILQLTGHRVIVTK
ncbi:MAG: PA2779 family protein [Thermodesulfovibrionales bacterium]